MFRTLSSPPSGNLVAPGRHACARNGFATDCRASVACSASNRRLFPQFHPPSIPFMQDSSGSSHEHHRAGSRAMQAVAEHLEEAAAPMRQVMHTLMHPDDAAAEVAGHIMSRGGKPGPHGPTLAAVTTARLFPHDRDAAAGGVEHHAAAHADKPKSPLATPTFVKAAIDDAVDGLQGAAQPVRDVVHTIMHPQATAADMAGHMMSRTNAPEGHQHAPTHQKK